MYPLRNEERQRVGQPVRLLSIVLRQALLGDLAGRGRVAVQPSRPVQPPKLGDPVAH